MKVHACVRTAVAVAVAVMGLGVAGAARAEDAQFTATASLSNLQFNLVSLNPGSGVMPWMAFNGEGTQAGAPYMGLVSASGLMPEDVDERTYFVSGAFDASQPWPSATYVSLDGRSVAQVGPGAFRVSSTLSASGLLPSSQGDPGRLAGSVTTAVQVGEEVSPYQLIESANPDGVVVDLSKNLLGFQNLTISPHSRLTVTGYADISAAQSGAADTGFSFDETSMVESDVMISLVKAVPSEALLSQYAGLEELFADYAAKYGESMDRLDYQWLLGRAGSGPGGSGREVSVSLVNDGDDPMQVIFSTYAISNVILGGTAAVPEPGTWALMGLGLVGLMGASRRRAARA